MTDNDLYIYVMAHLAEHYKDGGACFRPTMDIFMLNRLKSEELDFTYIGGELEKIGLARFAENIKKVGDIWFDDAKDDKALFVMVTVAFSRYSFGSAHTKCRRSSRKYGKHALFGVYANGVSAA